MARPDTDRLAGLRLRRCPARRGRLLPYAEAALDRRPAAGRPGCSGDGPGQPGGTGHHQASSTAAPSPTPDPTPSGTPTPTTPTGTPGPSSPPGTPPPSTASETPSSPEPGFS